MKSLLLVIILLSSHILSVKVNQLIFCTDKGAKTFKTTRGYKLNDYVKVDGVLFKAVNMKGEIKVPSLTDTCLEIISCQQKNMQWMYMYVIICV